MRFRLLLCLTVVGCAAGCARFHAHEADKAVYGALRDKHSKEFGFDRPFTIDGGPSRNLDRTTGQILGDMPPAGPLPEMLAESNLARLKQPLRELDLASALRLARANSRTYQTQKETVYLAALNLTTQQYVFDPHFALSGGVNRVVEGEDRIRSLESDATFNLSQQLMTGALVVLDLGLTGVKYLNQEFGTTLASVLTVSVDQPLWRGLDRIVVMNNLIQAHRNVIYELRSFARFEKQFAVDVASSYYNVLQQLDVVGNEWENYKNLTISRRRSESLAEAGRLPLFQVDQARQDEFRARNRYLQELERFEQQLDAFCVQLGLPADAPLILSRQDLEALSLKGVQPLEVDADAAVAEALLRRLDLKNAREAIQDADRQAHVAADALKGDVNLVGGFNVGTLPQTRAGRFMFHEGLYEFGLEVDLPLDKLNQRNAYRQSLINCDVSVRSYMNLVDTVKQNLRQSLRRLRRTEQTYEIQKNSVDLAQRRVASTQLLLEAGRADTRDVLESQEALVLARNALSQALVAHLVARLEFARDLELMEVDEEGQIHEGNIDGIGKAPDGPPPAPGARS